MNTRNSVPSLPRIPSFLLTVGLLGGVFGFSGCGGTPQNSNQNLVPAPAVMTPPDILPLPVILSTPPPSSPTNSGLNYDFRLQATTRACNNSENPTPTGVVVGTYQTPPMNTDNIFKVTVKATPPSTLPCTGYMANYSCVQFMVTVGTRSQSVQVSYGTPAGQACAGVPNSVQLDFSDQASPGHGPLTVSVSQPMTDNCRVYGYPNYAGCPMATPYDNYITNGQLVVTTNSYVSQKSTTPSAKTRALASEKKSKTSGNAHDKASTMKPKKKISAPQKGLKKALPDSQSLNTP